VHPSTSGSASSLDLDVSIVVPTFNRCAQLIRLLDALVEQELTTPSGRRFSFEVIVVSDGSTDGTGTAVRDFAARVALPVRLAEQANAGPAAARNLGVQLAAGTIVIFFDDDVVPGPDCAAVHVDRHDRQAGLVVIGPMLTPADSRLSPWVAWEQHQLEKQYRWFAAHSERADHTHFYTGNASVERAALLQVGGFDTDFTRAEDVELAYRLSQAGQTFIVDLNARAYHHAERSIGSWLRTAFDYGGNDVRFARMGRKEYWDRIHENFSQRNPLLRRFTAALFRHRRAATLASTIFVRSAVIADRVGLSRLSRSLLSCVYALANASGAARALGSSSAFLRLVRYNEKPSENFVCLVVLEQTLGHITHSKNLQSLVPTMSDVTPIFLPIDADVGRLSWLPGTSNWTVRAGIRARRAVGRALSTDQGRSADAMFVHTQVPAVLLGRWMRKIPTVVSIDATPKQYDALGEHYSHVVGPSAVEWLKTLINVRCFVRAEHVIAWSSWAKTGLVEQYGIEPARITVIPPGVDVHHWATSERRGVREDPLRVLFVGGDLHRKGGDLLISAARLLGEDSDVPAFEVHLVTTSDVAEEPGVVVHSNLLPNSPELVEQYHRADIFCLPTLGDCLPMVLAEAAAAGLPLIATDVGAIREVVQDETTGRLIRPGRLDDLVAALRSMLMSENERLRLGEAARDLALREHDAQRNARRIIEVLRAASRARSERDGLDVAAVCSENGALGGILRRAQNSVARGGK
jgi:glycosyltransferase involved in cell wall biosynthesis/GT2 family glycosyltransferase